MNNKYKHLRVGLLGLGLEAYWEQFDGLEARLLGHLAEVEQRISRPARLVFNFGLVDSVPEAVEVGHSCRRNDIDILLVYVTTYALSATVLPVILRAKVPVIFLNLQPASAIEYESFNKMTSRTAMTGEWLAHCSSCPMPEIANVLMRLDKPFYQVTGMLRNDPLCWQQVEEWLCAAEVAHALAHCRLGLMGHYYSGMLDIYTDLTQQYRFFGGHIELIEVDELAALRRSVTGKEIDERVQLFYSTFDVQHDCSAEELQRAARTSIALDRLTAHYQLGSMAYYYKGTGNAENEDTISSIILGNSLLTARGIPVAGEYEVKNAQAMKIMDSFGAGGSFTEYYAMDFKEDIVLMGHDGPGHIAIAEGKTKVRPLYVYHGKVGRGLSVEMSVKNGPVTLLSVVQQGNGKLMLLTAEAASVPGPILEIGNTNSRYKFSIGARRFVNDWNSHGPAHHCAVGVGLMVSKIRKLGLLLGMEVVQVC